jgi:predicted metal-dependent peptidase
VQKVTEEELQMEISISQYMLWLLSARPFYGALATSLNRVCKPGMGTMAVGVDNGRISLFYDPEFIKDIDMGAATFILEHEMLHLALDHIPRYLELLSHLPDEARDRARPVFNIAADCAINSLLRGSKHFQAAEDFTKKHCEKMVAKAKAEALAAGEPLEDDTTKSADGDDSDDVTTDIEVQVSKKGGRVKQTKMPKAGDTGMCLPEKYGLKDLLSFETYQLQPMQKVKVLKFNLSTHDLWGGDPGGDQTADSLMGEANRLREQLKKMLRQALQHAGGTERGLLPGGVEEFLSDYLADPIIPWWEVFATRAKTSKTAKYRRSVTTPNRSLMALSEEDDTIIPFPGRVRDKSWRVFLMVDTSGSMSSESLEIVKSELQHMLRADEGMELRYMQGDAAVHFDVLLKPGDEIPGQMCGRGGTDFTEYFRYMQKYCLDDGQRPDIVVVYTDGYAPPIEHKWHLPEDVPVIWLVTPQHSKEMAEQYGEIIVCDSSHNGLYKK